MEASSSIPTLPGGMDPKILSSYLSLMNASNVQNNGNTLLPFSLPSQYHSQQQSQQFISPNTQPWTQIQNTCNQAPNHARNPFMNLQQGQDQQYQQMNILLNNTNSNNYHQAPQPFINSLLSWMQNSQEQQTQQQLLKNIIMLIQQNGQHQQNPVAITSMLMKLLSEQEEQQPEMNLLSNLLHSLQNNQDQQSQPCLNQARQFMNQNGMWNMNNSTNQSVSNTSLPSSQTPSQVPVQSQQCSQNQMPQQILLNNLLHSLQNQDPQSQPCLNQARQFMNQNGLWNMNNSTKEPTNQSVGNTSLSASQTPSQATVQKQQCSQNQMPFALKQTDETSPRTLKDPHSTTKEISKGKNMAEENIAIHSKEEEDAGRTLLGFLAELRKNHMEALNNLSTSSDESEPTASRDVERPKKPKSNSSTNTTLKSQTHADKQALTSSLSLSLLKNLKAASANQSSDDMMSSKALTATSCSSATLPSDVSGGDTESNSDCRNSSNESDSMKCGSSDDEVDKMCSKGPVRKRFKKSLVSE
jgi:hypothetical protein